MAQVIRTVERGGFKLMLLTVTNIQSEAYLYNHLGYDVTCLAAPTSSAGGAHGGVGMVTRERPVGWGIESMRYHGPNVVSCEIITGLTRTPLVGAYLPLLIMEHLIDLEEALQHFRDPVVLGDLNMDLDEARILRSQ